MLCQTACGNVWQQLLSATLATLGSGALPASPPCTSASATFAELLAHPAKLTAADASCWSPSPPTGHVGGVCAHGEDVAAR
jgi:hypothetical protein